MTRRASTAKMITMPVGVILRRSPGATRWAEWVWAVAGLLPGAGPGNWHVLRHEGEVTDFHAATVQLSLHRTETEAYLTALNGVPPSVFVILRTEPGSSAERPEVLTITASAFEAQDYADNGEDIVERVPMSAGLQGWVGRFVQDNHAEEAFVKRKRKDYFDAKSEDGIGDARVRQTADVFRAPGSLREKDT